MFFPRTLESVPAPLPVLKKFSPSSCVCDSGAQAVPKLCLSPPLVQAQLLQRKARYTGPKIGHKLVWFYNSPGKHRIHAQPAWIILSALLSTGREAVLWAEVKTSLVGPVNLRGQWALRAVCRRKSSSLHPSCSWSYEGVAPEPTAWLLREPLSYPAVSHVSAPGRQMFTGD